MPRLVVNFQICQALGRGNEIIALLFLTRELRWLVRVGAASQKEHRAIAPTSAPNNPSPEELSGGGQHFMENTCVVSVETL
jgi:hypothetical protein